MNKKTAIKDAFKRLIEVNAFDDITVQSLCKECQISRQTFYYYYIDMVDAVTDFFLNEKIDNIDETKSWSDIVHCILVYASKNRQLVIKVLRSRANNSVTNFFFNCFYKNGRKFIEEKHKKNLNNNEIDEITKLSSNTLSIEIARLLTSPNEFSIAAIEEDISKTFDGVLELICHNYQKKKHNEKRRQK